jgi:hypothetical protein
LQNRAPHIHTGVIQPGKCTFYMSSLLPWIMYTMHITAQYLFSTLRLASSCIFSQPNNCTIHENCCTYIPVAKPLSRHSFVRADVQPCIRGVLHPLPFIRRCPSIVYSCYSMASLMFSHLGSRAVTFVNVGVKIVGKIVSPDGTPHTPSIHPVRRQPTCFEAVTTRVYPVPKANVSLGRHGKYNGMRAVIGVLVFSIVFWYEPQTMMLDRDFVCGICA